MKRAYEEVIAEHFLQNRQMVFLMGPRQVGKTTTSLEASLQKPNHFYFNWDNQAHRLLILDGQQAVAKQMGLERLQAENSLVIFDEIHKFPRWKDFLKGFFDLYGAKTKILVTGSARLDVLKSGGDSLMGRYFLYRLHPLSVREVIDPAASHDCISLPMPISEEHFDTLFRFGGFPEPFLQNDERFYNRWKKLRTKQLFQEDLQDITNVQEVRGLELLTDLLRSQSGQLLNYSELAKKIHVANETVRRWIDTLGALYYCFTIQPWSKNVTRSLLKGPKLFLWDWSVVPDNGQRLENFVASHLLKAVHFWTDLGIADFRLHFLRDKEKREVDFIVTRDDKPWFLVEVKTGRNSGLSKSLYHFQEVTGAAHAFQVTLDLPYVNKDCFSVKEPVIVPLTTFLSQLV